MRRVILAVLMAATVHSIAASASENAGTISNTGAPYATYVVTLAETDVADPAAMAHGLALEYGGRLEEGTRSASQQFKIAMSSARAAVMRLDARVESVREDEPGSEVASAAVSLPRRPALAPRPTGSGSLTFGPYSYDGSGNIKSIGMGGTQQETYQYDLAGRLKSATAGVTNTQTYTYDAFGNRTGATLASGSSACTGNAACAKPLTVEPLTNRIACSGTSPCYDAAGNFTRGDNEMYAYDAVGMMTQASIGATVRQFLYSADDERIAVYDSAFSWTWTVRGTDGKVLREFSSTNDSATGTFGASNRHWVKDYIWRDGLLLSTENATSTGTVRFDYHLDHLGTPRLVTNGAGVKVSAHTYYAFGAELNTTDESPAEAMKFTGHERDITGGPDALDYMHARYYLPTAGRFLSTDKGKAQPQRPQSWNKYSYCWGDPVQLTDPTGNIVELAGARRRRLEEFEALADSLEDPTAAGQLVMATFSNGRSIVSIAGDVSTFAASSPTAATIAAAVASPATITFFLGSNSFNSGDHYPAYTAPVDAHFNFTEGSRNSLISIDPNGFPYYTGAAITKTCAVQFSTNSATR